MFYGQCWICGERWELGTAPTCTCKSDDDNTMCYRSELEAAVKAEREACAQLCERMARRTEDIRRAALEAAAENIRARGQDPMPLFDDWDKDWTK